MEDFIDAKLEYKEDGRIAKQALLNSYLEMYPKHQRSMQQMISAMKDKGIVYNFSVRCNNIKGCFIGVQFKQQQVVNQFTNCNCEITINKQQQEIEYLKKQLADLQSQLKNKENNNDKEQVKKIKPKTKKESKIEIIEPTTLFSNDDLMDSFNESLNDLL